MSVIRADNFGPSAGGTTRSLHTLFIENKYTNWYFNIIDNSYRQNRKKNDSTYYENHHIIPKFMGGANKKNNLVLLTGKEHFIAHLLLVKMLDGQFKHKAIFALNIMTNKNDLMSGRYHSRSYELARKWFAEMISEHNKNSISWNKGRTKETCEIIAQYAKSCSDSRKLKPQVFTEEHRKNLSLASSRPRKPLSDDHKEKLSVIFTGQAKKPHTENTKSKISDSNKKYWADESRVALRRTRFWYNNGEINKVILEGDEVPSGFVKGRIVKPTTAGFIWVNDGVSSKFINNNIIPDGFVKGRIMI
jgi:hypothetical protein